MHKVPGVDFGFCFQYIDHPTGAVSIQYIINYKFPCHADTEASVIDNKTHKESHTGITRSRSLQILGLAIPYCQIFTYISSD